MFTGIVEELGRIRSIECSPNGMRLTLQSELCSRGVKAGDSLAVNGCCLTIVRISSRATSRQLEFDILNETWQRTNLKACASGSAINLERPLAASGRFHGHIVTGHIDGVGAIKSFGRVGADWRLEIQPPANTMKYFVEKGSIAVDGISLTVAALSRKTFTVWIIPHTYEATALQSRKPGDEVNLEFDLLGKYVERLLQFKRAR